MGPNREGEEFLAKVHIRQLRRWCDAGDAELSAHVSACYGGSCDEERGLYAVLSGVRERVLQRIRSRRQRCRRASGANGAASSAAAGGAAAAIACGRGLCMRGWRRHADGVRRACDEWYENEAASGDELLIF